MQSEKDALIELYAGDAFKNRNNPDLTIGVWRQHFVEFANKLAALSAAEPVSSRNDEAGYVEFLNEDVPYIVRDIQGAVAILMDLETRNVIGYRVYDPDSVFAPPAPSVAVKALQAIANYRHHSRLDSDENAEAMEQIARSALSAQVQDVAGWQVVPKDDERRCVADSALPHEMIEAGIRVQEQVNDDNCNYVAGETTDWDCGMVAVAIYRAMLAAAPAKQDGGTNE